MPLSRTIWSISAGSMLGNSVDEDEKDDYLREKNELRAERKELRGLGETAKELTDKQIADLRDALYGVCESVLNDLFEKNLGDD